MAAIGDLGYRRSHCQGMGETKMRAEMTRSCLRCVGFAGAVLLAVMMLSASPAAAESGPVRTQLAQLPPSRLAPPIVNGKASAVEICYHARRIVRVSADKTLTTEPV
jgi:hypothetical protein